MPKNAIGQRIVREYLERFPNAATKTLARRAYAENPAVWASLEGCRTMFRYARGNSGKYKRECAIDKTHFRPNKNAGDPFNRLPPGLHEMEGWAPFVIEQPGRWLLLGDLHNPYHDDAVLRLVMEAHKKVDGVILLGDLMDCYSLSRWEPDPRERDFAYEIESGRLLLAVFREYWPKARIIYKLGNHDERLERYLSLKAPELLGVADFEMKALLQCDKHNVDVVADRRPIELGKMHLIHGHEYRFSISNPVNPARGLFLRGKTIATCGHFHQTSQHSEKALDDKIISCWSIGCVCDLHPRYMPLNKWNHGYATIDVDEKGGFRIQNYRIIKGEIWS